LEPKNVNIGGPDGDELKCVVCGHNEFLTRSAQLNTAGMSFLGLDWANESAVCNVCDRCGYIHWFVPRG
jgi:predicted nucleic-acid-binding Zn-ribbon protein